MTRRFFLTVLIAMALTVLGPRAGQAGGEAFIGGIEDLPLMAGLAEDANLTLVFETPEGRIIEADAEGPIAADAVRRFYDETLPQLGWDKLGPDRFAREGEALKLDYSEAGGTTRVRFRLGPRN